MTSLIILGGKVIGTIFIVLAIILFIFAIIIISNIKVISQANAYVIEKFGKYHKTLGAGVHFLVPFMHTQDYYAVFQKKKVQPSVSPLGFNVKFNF